MQNSLQEYKDGLITINGYNFFPYEISSFGNTNTKTYAIEPTRGEDFSIANIDDIPTAEIPRLRLNFEIMSLSVWRRLKLAFKPNQFNVTYYDWEYDRVVTHKMYFATQDEIDIFENYGINQEYYIVNKKTVDIVGTMNDVNTISITYNANGGSGSVVAQEVSPNELITLSNGNTLKKQGYRLTMWNTAPDGSGNEYPLSLNLILSQNIVLYAIWQPTSERTLSFDYQGARKEPLDTNNKNWIINKQVNYNSAVGELPLPKYYITEKLNDSDSQLVEVASLIGWYNLPYDFKTNGRNHSQWLNEQQNNSIEGSIKNYDAGTIYNVDGNSTIYAHWLPKKVEITFRSNGGTYYAPLSSYYKANLDREKYTPVKYGKVFDGWFTDENLTIPFNWVVGYKDVVLYAKWI